MEKEIKQILKNQVDIMKHLLNQGTALGIRLQETSDLLNPKQSNEPCCDIGEDVKSREGVKND